MGEEYTQTYSQYTYKQIRFSVPTPNMRIFLVLPIHNFLVLPRGERL